MKFRKSLKTTLAINHLLVALLPIVIIGFAAHSLLTKSLTKEITARNFSIANSLAGQVEIFLGEPFSLLRQVKQVLTQKRLVHQESVNNYLDAVVKNYTFFEMIQVLDSGGQVVWVAPYDNEFIGANMQGQPFYRATLESGRPFWSPTFISMQTGQPTLTLSLPLDHGMLVGYLNLESLSVMTSRLKIPHGYPVITDQFGTAISHIRQHYVSERLNMKNRQVVRHGLAGRQGTFKDVDENRQVLASIVRVEQTGWLVICYQLMDETFAPLVKIRIIMAVSVVLTAIATIIVALVGLNKTLQPLAHLISNAKRVADGNYDLKALPGSFQEIGELTENFQWMTAAIKEREKEISESEQLYRSLVQTIPYGIQESDLEGNITFTNTAYDRIFQCDAGGRIGEPIWATAASETEKEKLKNYLKMLVAQQPQPRRYISKGLTKKGKAIDIQVDWTYKRDRNGELAGFVSVVTDITEQLRMEDNLRQTQKMEAIGTLTGGIAHDFNNILAAILGYAELVQESMDQESRAYKDQEEVITAAMRAKELVQHMLTFSRKSERKKGPLEVHLIVKEALKLLRATIPTTIRFKQNIDSAAGVIEADPTQIHQVVMNLCTNAAHAMEENGGTLEVDLFRVEFDEEELNGEQEAYPGAFVCLRVKDSGGGIRPEIQDRIFDPFFTTKETGKGTGMGLAVVHGIVKSHDGFLHLSSSSGQGTEFKVYFPRSVLRPPAGVMDSREIERGNERILVVDDEEVVVRMMQYTLERIGYRVCAKTDSAEALKEFSAKPGEYDLVITDQTMPNLTGAELASEILKIRPGMPIILCTGYSSIINEQEAKAVGIMDYALKPLDRADLARRVRRVLERG